MMNESKVQGILGTTIEEIRSIADANTMIGDPVVMNDEITILPVSKISCGFASGGSDFSVKNATAPVFGGAGGGGVTVTPVAFIVVNKGIVKVININTTETPIDKAISMVPELVEQIKGLFQKNKQAANENDFENQ